MTHASRGAAEDVRFLLDAPEQAQRETAVDKAGPFGGQRPTLRNDIHADKFDSLNNYCVCKNASISFGWLGGHVRACISSAAILA